jgi:hypothetical protein
MTMNDGTREHYDFLENVLHEERYKKRKDGHGRTWRYKLAEGLKQVIDHKEYKKEIVRKRQAKIAAEAELEEIKRRMNEMEKLL